MTKIKICGLRRLEDIAYANQLKPDYIGFVFAKSKRQITPAQGATFRATLHPQIPAVGVFVNAPIQEITALLEKKIINLVQLHGDEDATYIQTLKATAPQVPIIKAVPVPNQPSTNLAQGDQRTEATPTDQPSTNPTTTANPSTRALPSNPSSQHPIATDNASIGSPTDRIATTTQPITSPAATVNPSTGASRINPSSHHPIATDNATIGATSTNQATKKTCATAKQPPDTCTTASGTVVTAQPSTSPAQGDQPPPFNIPNLPADYLLFDTYDPTARGGTGATFCHDLLKGYQKPYFLAGGLNPSNLAAAIQTLHPFCVDLSSGAETDGTKDVAKMQALIAIAHNTKL